MLGTPKLRSLQGRRVLMTAGPTCEDLDPVRTITNRSSGAMGIELARAFRDVGARVQLVLGGYLPAPWGVETTRVRSAQQMLEACEARWVEADGLVAAAAVAEASAAAARSAAARCASAWACWAAAWRACSATACSARACSATRSAAARSASACARRVSAAARSASAAADAAAAAEAEAAAEAAATAAAWRSACPCRQAAARRRRTSTATAAMAMAIASRPKVQVAVSMATTLQQACPRRRLQSRRKAAPSRRNQRKAPKPGPLRRFHRAIRPVCEAGRWRSRGPSPPTQGVQVSRP